MPTTLAISAGVVSLIFGILVIAFPKFLRILIGIYFILLGIFQLLG
jgi:uncharacterized membrane protein HdeD (DUF308 family)